ncbi:MAG TPA: nuclear transport factor 2 family protein [Steroidobacteraceae bacterium]|nr:nuclear transport factor 2 family protein [Steroidobacteraceae bacterium]HRX90642.1 nuclear transport factor 2 family protein [Steroidobacteraceae bacterium]
MSVTHGGLLVLAALVLSACSEPPVTLPEERHTALETAFNGGDVDACVALYTEDAEILAEDAPIVRGRRAIREYFVDQAAREIQLDTETALSIASGDLAVEQGTYRIRNVKVGQDVEYGEYLHVWRRGDDGLWHIFRTMINMTQAQRGSVSVSPEAAAADPADAPE